VPRIKLAASNFARWFFGIPGRESHILGNSCSPISPKSDELNCVFISDNTIDTP